MNLRRESCRLFDHEAGEGGDVKSGECFGLAFVIFDEAAEAGGPRERPLDHPGHRTPRLMSAHVLRR